MCGIVGAVNFQREQPASMDALSAMLASLYHRGPDDEGRHVGTHVALGARRLSPSSTSAVGISPSVMKTVRPG